MTCKLVLKFKDTVISECPLDQEETTIGRKPDNAIHIDNLAVSGRHARVLRIGNKAILEDLNSTNGTLVNNKKITKHILQHGDTVHIGKHTLIFVNLDEKGAEAEEAVEAPQEEDHMDKTMILSPQARSDMMSSGQQGAGSHGSAASMPLGAVQIIAGPSAGKTIELSASLTSIGKGDACKIKVKGLTVGKQAAVITRRPTGYHIAHLEGMAKTKVNGETVSDQPRTLNDGDIIELSDTKMEFFIKES
jgi:pSer/pThr/pTyr-binding forkhead associated (FHA) protein